MKKKMYEKPSLEVVKVQASVAMLAGSTTGNANLQNYNRITETDED